MRQDDFMVECMASLFVCLATILCWTSSTTDPMQYMPALVLGLVLICIKDENYFFPDTSPTVTFVLWVLGGYGWGHMVARMCGQTTGFAIALWICLHAELAPLRYRVEHGLPIVFALETIGTVLEHMAVVYVILPLLPPAHGPQQQSHHHHHRHHHHPNLNNTTNDNFNNNNNAYPSYYHPYRQQPLVEGQYNNNNNDAYEPSGWRGVRRVKPKSHHEAQAPHNSTVLHAALVFAGLHWCLSRGFCIEMTPLTTLLLAILRSAREGDAATSAWATATIALWAQAVGVLVTVSYVALFAPRSSFLVDATRACI